MGLTAQEKAALIEQAQVAPKAPVVDTDAALLQEHTSPSLEETELAKLARLARKQRARETAALAGQGTSTDVIALGQDAKAKAALSEKLRKDFKVVDATWDTDFDMDKWYGAKIASLDAALEANKAGNIFYTKINDYNRAGATEANIMDLTGQLARNRNQFDQLKAGTHAWAKNPEGGWTFEEAKAELAGGLEELDAAQTAEFNRLVAMGWGKEDATLLVAPLDAAQTAEFDRLRAGGWSKDTATLRAKGQYRLADVHQPPVGAGEPAVEEAAPARPKMTLEARKPLGYEKSEWAYSDNELMALAEKGEFPPGLELTAPERDVGGGMLPKLAPIEPGYQVLPDNKYDRFVWLRERREKIRVDTGNEIKRKEGTPKAIAVLTVTAATLAVWVWGPVITGLTVAQLKAYAVSIGVDLALMYGAAKFGQWMQEDELEELRQEVDKLKNAQGNYEWDQTDSGDTGQAE